MKDGKLKVHGFQSPFHPLQISSWFVFTLLLVAFHVLQTPVLPYPATIPITIVYDLLVLMVVFSCGKTTLSDSRDVSVPDTGANFWAGEDLDTTAKRRALVVQDKTWCIHCKTHVFTTSKHCRLCDKCVGAFDHHCKWFNNCIGAVNYRMFFIAIHSVFLMMSFQCATVIWLIAMPDKTVERLRERYDILMGTPYTVMLSLLLAIIVPLMGACVHLIGLHWLLIWRGQTTYEWILDERERKQRRAKERAEKKELKIITEQKKLVLPAISGKEVAVDVGTLSRAPNTTSRTKKRSRKNKKKKIPLPEHENRCPEEGNESGDDTEQRERLPGLISPSHGKTEDTSAFNLDKESDASRGHVVMHVHSSPAKS